MADATAHPSLFEMAATPLGALPRCRMCTRSARWNSARQQWAMYCAGSSCTNRERVCQASGCGRVFHINVDGAGTKYCSADCKAIGYGRNVAGAQLQGPGCAWCGKPNPDHHRGRTRIWPYICAECISPIKHLVHRLKNHRVPHEMARRLLDAPGCEVCGRDIVSKARSGDGRVRADLVVDHDHTCCPAGSKSCGLCIRGFLCTPCNTAAGFLRDSPEIARRLADYIERPRL